MAETEHGSEIVAPHPREAPELVGHGRAWAAFMAALDSGRVPHAWLLVGTQGVGKATFAYRAALEVLSRNHRRPDDRSVRRRVRAGSHGDLHAIELEGDVGANQGIPVDHVRKLRSHLGYTAAEAGWRVAVVDALDHLSSHGRNALLKMVEEPPPRTLLFLIAHRVGAVPATIRSRCLRLPFANLPAAECMRVLERWLPDRSARDRNGLARLASGAPGRALSLAQGDALTLLDEITGICRPLPALDVAAAHAFGDRIAGSQDARRFPTFFSMFRAWVYRTAVRIAAGDGAVGADIVDGEGEAQRRYGAGAGIAGVLGLWNDVGQVADAAAATQIDRKQAVLDVLFAGRRRARDP